MTGAPALALHALSVSLGGRRVLEDVSLTVQAGRWACLIGPNGAGKSTLLRAACGIARVDSGEVAVASRGLRTLDRRDRARRIAYVPQSPLLPPGMRVRDYVLLGRTPHLGTFASVGPADEAAVDEAMLLLDLSSFAARELSTLSGGERQRAVLARAVAQAAPLLLLDEPTTALDLGRQQQVLELVAELRTRSQLTVVSATHDLTLAAQHADQLLLLAGGRLVADGPPAAVVTEALVASHYGARVRVELADGVPVAVIPVAAPRRPVATTP